ncbi:MAG: tyrosine-type recombinase/integrase [Planctomycetes bacterium]|nr:tyrosine-type recombinase/integrase [Planctomycetota bacterium]
MTTPKGKKVTIRPGKVRPGLHNFPVTFRNPLKAKIVSGSLGTSNEDEAWAICRDLERLCLNEDLWHDPESPRLVAYKPRAVELFFGKDSREAAGAQARAADTFTDKEGGDFFREIGGGLSHLGLKGRDARRAAEWFVGYVAELRTRWEEPLRKRIDEQENKLKALEPEVEELRLRNRELAKQRNVNLRITAGEAFDTWVEVYAQGRAAMTATNARQAVSSFVAALPKGRKTKLADIEGPAVAAWQDNMRGVKKGKAGELLKPGTIQARTAYLSAFFTWCRSRLGYVGNPLAELPAVAGAQRSPESIVAIRRREDLKAFLDALAPEPYWQAWAAVACLGGPRYSEQVRLRIEDVYLEDGYFRVATLTGGRRARGTKTGRERNVPIERTVLLPILKVHLERRQAERRKRGGTAGECSEWLFPTIVPDNPYLPREKAPPGQWSHNRTWTRAWEACADACTGRVGEEPKKGWKARPAYWEFGPAEWRHTFGTVLGMCGWASLEISRVMGNSEDVAKRHYVGATAAGSRWSYKWGQ